MLQRAVSAGRGARSKADFAPRTVAGGAGAAGGGRGRDLGEGGALLSSPGRNPRRHGTGQPPFRCRNGHCKALGRASISYFCATERRPGIAGGREDEAAAEV